MAQTFYVDPNAASGSGSAANPAPSVANLTWAVDTEVIFTYGKLMQIPSSGRVWNKMQPTTVTGQGFRFSVRGNPANGPAGFRGDVDQPTGWQAMGGGVYRKNVGTTWIGPCFLNGTLLKYYNMRIQGSNALSGIDLYGLSGTQSGYSILPGAGTNWSTGQSVEVRLPNGAAPNGTTNIVSVAMTAIGFEINQSDPVTFVESNGVSGITMRGMSRQGMNWRAVGGQANTANGRCNVQSVYIYGCGGDVTNQYHVGGGFQITGGAKNINFINSTVRDCYDAPFSPQLPSGPDNVGIENITYENNLIDRGWSLAGIECSIFNDNGFFRNILIKGNTFIHDADAAFSTRGDTSYNDGPHGISVGGTRYPMDTATIESFAIEDNRFYNVPGAAIEFINAKSANESITVRRNYAQGCGKGGARFPGGPGTMGTTPTFGISDPNNKTYPLNVVFEANVAVDCGTWGFECQGNNSTSGPVLYNNTTDSGIHIQGGTTNATLRNNLAYNSAIDCPGATNEDYNFAGSFTSAKGANSSTAAPGLTDPGNLDFTIAAGSPLINSGEEATTATTDVNKALYITFDIGAYRYLAPPPPEEDGTTERVGVQIIGHL